MALASAVAAVTRELARIDDQLRRSLRGGAWHGPAVLELLDDPLVDDAPYSAYVQFIGLTQHDLYHAGQIAVLKRALEARRSAP